ncbi:MAG: glutamate racemase [Spirochaetota bacterium]
MSLRTIAFLDSGVGGVPYLVSTRTALPNAAYAYYADNLHFPYGERSVEGLREIVIRAAARLIELVDPVVIVVACNTASVVALAELRRRFAIPFVGVVPAIKPAATLATAGRIGVLATSRTVEDPYLSDLISRFAPGTEVVLEAAGGLVRLVEERFGEFSEDEPTDALELPLRRLREAEVEAVVLGCTHFIHVRDVIERMLGSSIRVVDSVDGVVRQTVRVATERMNGALGPASAPPPPRVFVSSHDRMGASYAHLARAHGLRICDEQDGNRPHRPQ